MKKTLISSVNFNVYRVALYTIRNTIRESVSNVVSCRSVTSYFERYVYAPIRNTIADSVYNSVSNYVSKLVKDEK